MPATSEFCAVGAVVPDLLSVLGLLAGTLAVLTAGCAVLMACGYLVAVTLVLAAQWLIRRCRRGVNAPADATVADFERARRRADRHPTIPETSAPDETA